MDPKKLLLNLTEKEQKLLHWMTTEKEDIQIAACDGQESYICMNRKIIKPANLIIGYVSKEGKTCKGRYAEQHFALPNNSELLRVIVDNRKPEDVHFHVNLSGSYMKLSNGTKNDDSLLIMYIENPVFVQFLLYDGRLHDDKVSTIFATATTIKTRIRSIALSIFNQQFDGFLDLLGGLESSTYGKEE